MEVEVLAPDPGLHWQAVARMLARRDDLREDVTLRVDLNHLSFIDRDGLTVRALPAGKWVGGAIADIDVMLDFLAWLEREFAVPVAEGRFGCPIRGSRRRVRRGSGNRTDSDQGAP
jgi:hypothetical protein